VTTSKCNAKLLLLALSANYIKLTFVVVSHKIFRWGFLVPSCLLRPGQLISSVPPLPPYLRHYITVVIRLSISDHMQKSDVLEPELINLQIMQRLLWSIQMTQSHLTSSHLITHDFISTESQPTAIWVVYCEATQFAVAAINHSLLGSDEMRSVKMRSDKVR